MAREVGLGSAMLGEETIRSHVSQRRSSGASFHEDLKSLERLAQAGGDPGENTQSFVDGNIARPVRLRAPSRAAFVDEPQANGQRSVWMLAFILLLNLYCDTSVAMLNQVYKGIMDRGAGEACERLFEERIMMGLEAQDLEGEPKYDAEQIKELKWPSGDWQAGLDGFWSVHLTKVDAESVAIGEAYFDYTLQSPTCDWYIIQIPKADRTKFLWLDKEKECRTMDTNRDACNANRRCKYYSQEEETHDIGANGCYYKDCDTALGGSCYKRKTHSYTKGASLSFQSFVGLLGYWAVNYYLGGLEQLKMCFDFTEMKRFAVVGFLFGFAAVFSFLAQANLTPGSYTLYAQTGIVLVPLMWRLIFKTAIPPLTWVHIIIVACGICMYFSADQTGNSAGSDSTVGLLFVFFRVIFAGTASCVAEMFLKGNSSIPFVVQVSYILPWKVLSTFATVLVLAPHRFPPAEVRPGGPFHDWKPFVLVIIFHSLGDTVMSSLVAKVFDSVVKAVCGVFGIIFPTWIVSYIAGWESLDVGTLQGKFKAAGGVVVVLGAMAYVLGRAQAADLSSKDEELAKHKKDDKDEDVPREGSLELSSMPQAQPA